MASHLELLDPSKHLVNIITDIEYTCIETPLGTRPVVVLTMYNQEFSESWKQAFYLSNTATGQWHEVNDRLPLADQLPPDF